MDPDNLVFLGIAAAVLLVFRAMVAMGRTAITTLNDAKLKKQAGQGEKKAVLISRLVDEPFYFLESLGLASLFSTILAAVAVMYQATDVVSGLLGSYFHSIEWVRLGVLLLGAVVVTFLFSLLGELIPNRIASKHPEPVAFGMCRFIWLVCAVFRPFCRLNHFLCDGFGKIFGIRAKDIIEQVTEEEIRMMVDVGNEKGAIEQSEKDMIENIFEFDNRTVEEIMTHRTEVCAVSKSARLDRVMNLVIEEGYSRIPVYDDDIDTVIGVLYAKDLLTLISSPCTEFDVTRYMRNPYHVPGTTKCALLFNEFNRQKLQFAVVVDEYGGTAGVVSMEDLLESIVGNMQDEYDDEEEEISRLSEGVYMLDGSIALDDVERLLDVKFPEECEYDTLGGFIIEQLERIPESGEHPAVVRGEFLFTVEEIEERRIVRVRAEKQDVAKPDAQ